MTSVINIFSTFPELTPESLTEISTPLVRSRSQKLANIFIALSISIDAGLVGSVGPLYHTCNYYLGSESSIFSLASPMPML